MRVSQEEVAAHEKKNCVSKNDAAAGQKSKFFVSFVYTEDKNEKKKQRTRPPFQEKKKKKEKKENEEVRMEERRERGGEKRRGDDIYRPLWPLRRLPAEKNFYRKRKSFFCPALSPIRTSASGCGRSRARDWTRGDGVPISGR